MISSAEQNAFFFLVACLSLNLQKTPINQIGNLIKYFFSDCLSVLTNTTSILDHLFNSINEPYVTHPYFSLIQICLASGLTYLWLGLRLN